ncbi:hypothetical protein GCM10023074_44630 [Microbispora amethystogenes]
MVWAAGVSEGSTARTVAIGLTGVAPSFSFVTSEPLLCAISVEPAATYPGVTTGTGSPHFETSPP